MVRDPVFATALRVYENKVCRRIMHLQHRESMGRGLACESPLYTHIFVFPQALYYSKGFLISLPPDISLLDSQLVIILCSIVFFTIFLNCLLSESIEI